MDPIRILRVIARLNVGGPARHVILLTAKLDADAYSTLLVTGRAAPTEGTMRSFSEEFGVEPQLMVGLGRKISPWRDLLVLIRLYRLCVRYRPHVVHTHTAKAGVVGRLAAYLAGVPVIVHTYHGHIFHGYFSPAKTWVFLAIERWLGRFTHRLVTVSEAVRRDLLRLEICKPDRVVVIPLGLQLEPLLSCERRRGELRSELGLGEDTPLVGIIARLVPIKAHEVFLDAAARVAAREPLSRFLLVGDGERRGELEALVDRLGLRERVQFLGWREDLDRVLADLDIVALSSRNEGSPVCLIEAMAAARSVVATRAGGVGDVVEDGVTGCLVEVDNAQQMAQSILALLGDPKRRAKMGQAGRRRVYPGFSSQRLVDDIDRLYRELLAECSRDAGFRT
ncbi:MAG: glycosyltransferase family 4 protein [SAR202 cluster bacterium]|nr:glycosyl transferase [Acidobacteriota bacterium]MQG59569.1 glycosyltransferase family 4 protein [SAR202 cluster bacterium]MQG69942.1 glycosyltransferase family 4 protein [SAR202 cluster bacterium]HAL47877.1 glycosyltransferase family 1 protein [Dehalococcoidia bacterium]